MAENVAEICNAIVGFFKQKLMDPRGLSWEGKSLAAELARRSGRLDERQVARFLRMLMDLRVLQVTGTSRQTERWTLLMPDVKFEYEGNKLKALRAKERG